MFGNDHKNDQDDVQPMSAQPVNHGLLGIDDDDTPPPTGISGPTSSAPPVAPTPDPVSAPGPVIAPHDENSNDDLSAAPTTTPEVDDDTPLSTAPSPAVESSRNDDDLLNIKKEALEELSPLIDHLEQDSEEKFKTTMMMIQASDNKDLIPQAFAAAKAITDEKKRAQALLDIVNEINYFTHKSED